MTRVHLLFLIIWLSCVHCPAALAAKASPKPDRVSSPTQPNSGIVPPTPQQAPEETTLPHTEAQQPLPAAPTTSTTPKKPVYMTETIRMQRAWIYSAIVPGWGQAYNRHYWKIPTIYAVFGALGWGAVYNHKAALESLNLFAKEDAKRSRDLFVIFIGLLYVANVFDAYIDASLKTFNLSDDISVEVVEPHIAPTTQNKPTVGLGLTFKF